MITIQTDRSPGSLDVVDVDLLVVSELECTLAILLAKGLRLVDFGVFWQLAVRFHYEWREISASDEEYDDVRLRASSAVYLTITSALSSWKSRRERRMMSPWLIQT